MKNGRKNSPVRAPAVPDGRGKSETSGEFAIIARYFAPLATNPAALGLLDDAAVLSIPEGQELVATCDTITAGVHFPTIRLTPSATRRFPSASPISRPKARGRMSTS